MIQKNRTALAVNKIDEQRRTIKKVCWIIIGISVFVIITVQFLVANSEKKEDTKMTFNEYLISASQYAIIHEYDLPITTDFADKGVEGNYHIVETKTKNVYNIGGTVRIKNSNGILRDYKYVAKIEYLPDQKQYKEISAKIYD